MLTVKTSDEAEKIIFDRFGEIRTATEEIDLLSAIGRVLAADVVSEENVPDFNRSTVDGYAVKASSTFGCSESIPSILDYKGEVLMGQAPEFEISENECAYVPTGGELPHGADAMVMIEFSEDYGDGTRAMLKPSAPGQHVTYRGDDVKVGQTVLKAGTRLAARHIGALASLGYDTVSVFRRPRIAVISTGDELVDVTARPSGAQVRDINTFTICAAIAEMDCEFEKVGIVIDELPILEGKIKSVIYGDENTNPCDMVIVSGGSSVGVKDATFKVYDKLGEVLFHGIAIKPGKPTIFAEISGKPAVGLPGHPLAAYYIFNLFVKPLIESMSGETTSANGRKRLGTTQRAPLSLSIPCNHGREECMGIKLKESDGELCAKPVYAKSGLISVLSESDGFIRIARDCEGLSGGEEIDVNLF